MTYSIAIRTLGTGGENYRRLLESITLQTLQPERVVVYIADGYEAPDLRIGREEYVWVPKGMLAQRALRYDEIRSECIMLLDDDVELAPDTAEKMLDAIEKHNADCVAADTFLNHRMTGVQKLRAVIAGLVLPARTQKCAFRMRRCGAFSYLSHPVHGGCYPSDTAAGPCSMWRRQSLVDLHIEHELWVERCGFAYGEDSVYYMKLRANGKRLYVLFDSGAVHLDTGSSSGAFRRGARRLYVRAFNHYVIWHRCVRTIYPGTYTTICHAAREAWDFLIATAAGHPVQFLRAARDARRYVRSAEYLLIPPYRLP